MTLLWDGLRVNIPAGMEPVVLDRGFVRLAGAHGPVLDLRFGPEKSSFDPERDGRRLLKAAGLEEQKLVSFRPPWTVQAGTGVWTAAGPEPRLLVLHFRSAGGVVAGLFSTAPGPDLLREVLGSATWAPSDVWRSWRCFDLAFESPPRAVLSRASFRAGAFRVELAMGPSAVIVERLAPADVLLDGADIGEWMAARLRREHGETLAVTPDGPSRARFGRPASFWRRLLPWAASDQLSGGARHDASSNRIFILTTRGRPFPAFDFERMFPAHAAAAIQN